MSTIPPMAPPPVPPGQPAKKTSPLVWVLVGCGGLLVIVMIIVLALGFFAAKKMKEAGDNPTLFAAKLIAAADRDIEVVSSDSDADTVTLRNKKTGETITVDAEDIKQGRLKFRNERGEEFTMEAQGEGDKGTFRIRSDEGEVTFGSDSAETSPAWVPVLRGASVEGTYSAKSKDTLEGGFSFQTDSSVADVIAFYKRELESGGFKVSTTTFDQDGRVSGGMVQGATAGDARTVHVTLSRDEGRTAVAVMYRGAAD